MFCEEVNLEQSLVYKLRVVLLKILEFWGKVIFLNNYSKLLLVLIWEIVDAVNWLNTKVAIIKKSVD